MQFYSASFTGDLCHVVKHVGTLYPKSNLYAVGWSLGANILVRYLGEVGICMQRSILHSFFLSSSLIFLQDLSSV